MANPLRGEASFVLDGKKMTLVYDAEVFLEIEDETGLGLFHILGIMQAASKGTANVLAQIKIGTVASLVACGLRVNHPDIDRVAAAEMLLGPDAEALQEALGKALAAALPQPKEGGEGNAPNRKARRAGTGKKN